MIRFQEAVFSIKPDIIIETGIAHGGSLMFSASLCKTIGKGKVIGIDIDIRPHNRKAIENHELFSFITLIEGSSTAPEVVNQVKNLVKAHETVLVMLDSNHSKKHVLAELNAYAELVSIGSFIIATDGIMQDLGDVHAKRALVLGQSSSSSSRICKRPSRIYQRTTSLALQ